jgi:hypothetical protein
MVSAESTQGKLPISLATKYRKIILRIGKNFAFPSLCVGFPDHGSFRFVPAHILHHELFDRGSRSLSNSRWSEHQLGQSMWSVQPPSFILTVLL